MPIFQITEFIEAKLCSVTNRVEKHGDEDKPAITMALEIRTANTILDMIDPQLRQALYMRPDDGQEDLPELEQTTPALRCNAIDRVALPTKLEGWTLTVDDGLEETLAMVFGGVKADKFVVEPIQGGSVGLKFRVGTSDIDADRLGRLAMHNGQSIWITLTPPVPKPDAIDGSQEAFDADFEPDSTDLFAESED